MVVLGQFLDGSPGIAPDAIEHFSTQRLVVVGFGGRHPILGGARADLDKPSPAAAVAEERLGVLALDRLELVDCVRLLVAEPERPLDVGRLAI